MGVLQFKALPQDGRLWRLDWVGGVHAGAKNGDPVVDVQFSPSQADSPTSFGHVDFEHSIIIPLSIKRWPVLRIGTFWRDGTQAWGRAGELLEVTVDVQPQHLRLARAYDRIADGKFLIPPFEHAVRQDFASTSIVRLSVASHKRVVELDIPCSELFRAYYGHSSRLATHLLTGAFIDDTFNRVYDAERSWHRGDECFVQLGYRIKNSDAQIISRLAFDPVAHANAKRIVADTIVASAKDQPYNLTCYPPFHAKSNLTVRGRYLDNETRFLVYELLGCTAPFPASSIIRGRPSSERQASGAVVPLAEMRPEPNADNLTIDEASLDQTSADVDLDLPGQPIFRKAAVLEEAVETSASNNSGQSMPEKVSRAVEPNINLQAREELDELYDLHGRIAQVQLDDGVILEGVLNVGPGPKERLNITTSKGETVALVLGRLRTLELSDADVTT